MVIALLDVWMSHGDQVSELPPQFKTIASTDNCPIAGMADEKRQFYGLQFHPEVSHTRQGKRILERFVFDICGCKPIGQQKILLKNKLKKIREQVGNDDVIVGFVGWCGFFGGSCVIA